MPSYLFLVLAFFALIFVTDAENWHVENQHDISITGNWHIDSQSGATPVMNCANTDRIWGICNDKGCPGVWEQLNKVKRSCLGGWQCPAPDLDPTYVCRKVSGNYNGWAARNGMLAAYFDKSRCWRASPCVFCMWELRTYAWTALRGDDGSWINIAFAEHADCSKLN